MNPAAEGSEPSGHPNGRKADSGWPRRSVKPDPSGTLQVRHLFRSLESS